MQAYQIVLLAFFVVIFLYVSSAFFVISHAFDFRRRLSRKLDALTVLLLEKKACLKEIYQIVEAKGFADDGLKAKYDEVMTKEIKVTNDESFASAQAELKEFQTLLMFAVQGIKDEEKSAKLQQEIVRLRDLEASHRRTVVLYDNDCVAFNYWVSVPLFRLLCFLFQLKKKQMLN